MAVTAPHLLSIEHGSGLCAVRFEGELDLVTAPALLAHAREAEGGQATTIEVELSGVTFIDSVGIKALLLIHRRAVQRGTSVRIVVREEPVGRVLRTTGLDQVLQPLVEVS
jgi:anti-sigma B factor antagonist